MIARLLPFAALLLPHLFAQATVHEADFEYSNVGGRMSMDIVRPSGEPSQPRPAVVLIHGGGFSGGKRESYLDEALRLAERGYVAATVSYRLAPRNQFPAAVHDVKAAVRYLRANAARLGLDPDRIGAMGSSAGGHLALFLGVTPGVEEFEGSGPNRDQSSRVSCVVNFYGRTDFIQPYSRSRNAGSILPQFVGGDFDHARLANIRASPLHWVTPQAAPVLSIHGTDDGQVQYEHSVWITQRLMAAGVAAELETIPGGGHGFRGADAERANERAFKFLDRFLAARPAQTRILLSDHGPLGEVVAMDWPSGKVLWTSPNSRGHDVQGLTAGHVLLTDGARKKVIELNAQHQPVWTFDKGLEHPLAAQRLPNGNTLIGDAKLGQVIEVDSQKNIVWKYASPALAGMRMRNSRRTEAGTTLIAIEAEAKIIEVDKAGSIVWSWQADRGPERRAYQGLRLANGNTLVSLSDPGEVVEVDPSGKTVRSIGGAKSDVKFGWASGLCIMQNGNLLIADYTGRRIVEVDPAGAVVHELRTGPRTIASLSLAH